MVAVKECAVDGKALEEDEGVGEEALEESPGIAAAIKERAKNREALDEDEHLGE